MAKKPTTSKSVETLKHEDAARKNIPTAEYQSVLQKAEQGWSDLVVHVPPLYIQEKVHPKALINDLMRQTKLDAKASAPGSSFRSVRTSVNSAGAAIPGHGVISP